ncbi:recombination protein RecO [Campylobacter gastrosuis]|uniref:Recombination protein RecO n=1 Tax=Campylobacter gastrosuis TaxID=2974576 RepID=A0ABT7HNY0_9BACT|nr:recombination protein RecO [Campylobacter gastrosuis]MDL0088412.1 recombination protein RecO [Campylobacter gastrosuis]
MQGYILRTQKVKDEDLLVYVLTPKNLVKSYRFYGARHASVMSGYKIDFELNHNELFLPHLRSVLHLGFMWLLDRDKLIIWQQFMRLLYSHLKDIDELDEIYFNEVENCAQNCDKQSLKRLIIESYVRILEYEGRLHSEFECFVCDEPILDELVLARAFLPAHAHCLPKTTLNLKKIKELFDTKSTIMLEDSECDELFSTLLEGL